MARKSEEIFLGISLDASHAIKSMDALRDSLADIKKQRQELLKANGGDTSDPTYKALQARERGLKDLTKQFKKSFTDMQSAISNASKESWSAIDSIAKNAMKRIQSLRPELKGNAEKIKEYIRIYNEAVDESRKRKRAVDEYTRPFDVIKTESGLAENQSISRLKEYRKEFEHFANVTKNFAQRGEALKQVAELDRRIKQMEATPLRALSSVLDDIGKERTVNGLKELQKELVAVRGELVNDSAIAKANKALADLDSRIKQLTTSQMTYGEAMNVFSRAQGLLSQGASANAAEVREVLSLLKEARSAQGIKVSDAQMGAGLEKNLGDLLKGRGTEMMSAKQAADFYQVALGLLSQREKALASDIRMVSEQMKLAQKAEGISVEEARKYAEVQKYADEMLKKEAQSIMSAADAKANYAHAGVLVSQGAQAEAAEVRRYVTILREAQQAEGISAEFASQLAARERELTALLQQKQPVMMAELEIQEHLIRANGLLAQGNDALVTDVNEEIAALQRMQQVEGITIKQKQEYAALEKQLRTMRDKEAQGTMDQVQAEEAYRQALEVVSTREKAYASTVKQRIEDMERALKAENITVAQTQKYNAVLTSLRRQLQGTSADMNQLAYDKELVSRTLKNLNKAPLADIDKVIKMLDLRMKTLSRDTVEYANTRKQLEKMRAVWDGLNQKVKDQASFFDKAISKMASYLGFYGGFYAVREQVEKMFQANLKYDDSLSNIRKTTGLTAETVAVLAETIKNIDTRTTLQDMNDLAYSAGRLGVKGVSDVIGFVRAADEINIALGEQLGDKSQAIEQIMKITSIMGVQREYGLEESVRRLGSSINELTMNSQATAQPMVDFLKRTSGVATQAGISASELTGLAAAVNHLGQNVELSATSISKVLVQISSNSRKVMKALRLSAEEEAQFMYDISSGDMMSAFLTLLRKANEAGGLSHLGVIAKDLGSEGQRVIQTLATLSENYSTVEQYVRMSNDAFREGVSVTNEYNLKNDNVAARWEKLKNRFSKMFVSTDAVDYFRNVLEQLDKLPDVAQRFVADFRPSLEFLGKIALAVVDCSAALSGLFQAMLARTAFVTILGWVDGVRGGFATLSRNIAMCKTNFHGFAKAMRSASFGNIFIAAGTAILYVVNKLREAREETERIEREAIDAVSRVEAESKEVSSSINALLSKLKDANEGTAERKTLIEKINREYGSYLSNLIAEGEAYDSIEEKLRLINKQMKLKALFEGREQARKDKETEYNSSLGVLSSGLRDEIAGMIDVKNRNRAGSAASDIVRRLLEPMSNGELFGTTLLKRDLDEETGKTTGFSRYYGARGTDDKKMAQVIRGQLYQLFRDVVSNENANREKGDEPMTISEKNGFNPHTYSTVLAALEKYMDMYLKMEEEIAIGDEQWNLKIGLISKEIQERVTSQTENAWAQIAEKVNMPLAGADGSRINEVGKPTSYVGIDEKQPWIDDKARMTPKERSEMEDKVSAFMNIMDDYMLMLEGLDKRYEYGKRQIEENETDAYKTARMQFENAKEYRRVLRVGIIENKQDGSGSGGPKANDYRGLYADIIARIKDLFERQAIEYELQKEQGRITPARYDQLIEQNTSAMHELLRAARQRIVGDITGTAWSSAKSTAASAVNMNNPEVAQAMQNVQAVGDVRTSIGEKLEQFAKLKDEDGKATSALLSEIRKNATEDWLKILEIRRKQYEKILKLLFEGNETGKITEEYQQRMEELGLMFRNLSASSLEGLQQQERAIMEVMQQLGASAVNFDLNTDDGFDGWVERVAKMIPEVRAQWDAVLDMAEDARARNDRQMMAVANEQYDYLAGQLRQLYYETYQYDRAIDEAVSRMADKHRKLWEKMYKQGDAYAARQSAIQRLNDQKEYISGMTGFGFSSRYALASDFLLQEDKLKQQRELWNNNKDKAAQAVAAARQDQERGVDGADARLQAAQAELEKISQTPDEVRKAEDEVEKSRRALHDAIMSWLGDMSKAFDKFMDGIAPFRSWYEDNGSMAKNVFGTKAERQQAFGQFMDDIKKAFRAEVMEQVRSAMTKALLKRQERKEAEKQDEQLKADLNARYATEKDHCDALAALWENYWNELSERRAQYYAEGEKYRGLTPDQITANGTPVDADTQQFWNDLATEMEEGIAVFKTRIQDFYKSPMLAEANGANFSNPNGSADAPFVNHSDATGTTGATGQQSGTPSSDHKSGQPLQQAGQAGINSAARGLGDVASSAIEDKGALGGIGSSIAGEGARQAGLFLNEKIQQSLSKRRLKQMQKDTKDEKRELDKRDRQQKLSAEKQAEVVSESEEGKLDMKQTAGKGMMQVTEQVTDTAIQMSNKETANSEQNAVKESTTSMWGRLGGAVAKAWEVGGPYLGPVLAAGVTAAMGALITWVLNMMGHGKSTETSAPSTKLVSGMLTYDRGNVQSFAVRTFDDGNVAVMGDNGKVYSATPSGALGTGIVSRPTLTSIGGAPALVGEEGPEMVIGRETTHALQMSRPDIIRIIQEFDRNRSRGFVKRYDDGNVSDFSAPSAQADPSAVNSEFVSTVRQLSETLQTLQKNGIAAHINKYGRGGLVEETASGLDFMRRSGVLQSPAMRRTFSR